MRARPRSPYYAVRPLFPQMSSKAKPAPRRKSVEVVIPDRLYFRIGEVARLCKLPAYVLRFWETEFPQLKPGKSSTGQRMYRRRDVESVLKIRTLLYDQGFTIAGARQALRAESKNGKSQPALPFMAAPAPPGGLKHVRQGLKEILGILSAKR